MKTKQWVVGKPDLGKARRLANVCGFTPLAAATLCARSYETEEAAKNFLSVNCSLMHNPFLMQGMEQAVKVIQTAIAEKRKIIVFGDYDVDGITATCVLVRYLRSVGAECSYYIPNRISEGYGLNCAALDTLKAQGTGLVITVDSGITANEEIAYAHAIGLDMVITDHHECHEDLPDALAVVNPKRADCQYPFPELAGVGVAFKLAIALAGVDKQQEMLYRYADLVALGTVADVMPIVGENRIIAAIGLQMLAKTQNLGLEMLLREAGLKEKKLTTSAISFILAPRINAAGRLGQASIAAELFLTEDAERAQTLAVQLCEQNKARQTAENEILQQALNQLRREYNPLEDKMIVLAGEGWHHGVIGIVSSRICDRYACPTVLIALEGEMGKGSGRSIKGFNLFEALVDSQPFLEKFGGHELAAGLTVAREQVEPFKKHITDYAKEHIKPGDLTPIVNIDCMVSPDMITDENVEGLAILEPFGLKNPQPMFCMENLLVEEITPISSDRHVKVLLNKDGMQYSAMLFGTGVGGCAFAQGNYVDAAFHLEINEFRGRRTIQLILKDVHLSECELAADNELLDLYHTYMSDASLTRAQAAILLPNRAELVAVWRHIVSRAEEYRMSVLSNALSRRIRWESRQNINIGKLFVCLDVFSESGLLSYHFKEGLLNILVKHHEGKADISKSVVLSTLAAMAKEAK